MMVIVTNFIASFLRKRISKSIKQKKGQAFNGRRLSPIRIINLAAVATHSRAGGGRRRNGGRYGLAS